MQNGDRITSDLFVLPVELVGVQRIVTLVFRVCLTPIWYQELGHDKKIGEGD